MILTKTTCRACGAFPVFIDNETGEIWDDQDASEFHTHRDLSYYDYLEDPDDEFDGHRADDDGMRWSPFTVLDDIPERNPDDPDYDPDFHKREW